MPTSRQTLPTTLRKTPAFKVNCVWCEEPAFMSPSGAFSRAKIRVSPSFPESTWAKWALWKAQRELPFDDWQPQVLCLCDTMGHYKSSSFLLLQNNTEKRKEVVHDGEEGGFEGGEKGGGSGFWNGADVRGRRIRLWVLVMFTRLHSPSVVGPLWLPGASGW